MQCLRKSAARRFAWPRKAGAHAGRSRRPDDLRIRAGRPLAPARARRGKRECPVRCRPATSARRAAHGVRRRKTTAPATHRQARRLAGLKAVTARFAIPDDGRAQTLAHVFDVALEGGAGDGELLQKNLGRHDAPLMQHLVDFVEAFGAVHTASNKDGEHIFCALSAHRVSSESTPVATPSGMKTAPMASAKARDRCPSQRAATSQSVPPESRSPLDRRRRGSRAGGARRRTTRADRSGRT